MGNYKSLKIKYKQHLSIMGVGLSVNAPADALIDLEKALLHEIASKRDVTIKAFYNKVIYSLIPSIKKDQEEYKKFKESVKFASELRERRKKFAKKIDEAYEIILDKAPRFTVGVMDILGKIKINKDLNANDYKFLTEELEILRAKELKNDELKRHLECMKNLIDEFIEDNIGVIKRIKNDLKYIINRKTKELEFDKSVSFSQPEIKQGPRLDEHGKLSAK